MPSIGWQLRRTANSTLERPAEKKVTATFLGASPFPLDHVTVVSYTIPAELIASFPSLRWCPVSKATDGLFDAAMNLPEADRISLIGRLLETMPERDIGLSLDDSNLFEELDSRFADPSGSIAWSDLRAEG